MAALTQSPFRTAGGEIDVEASVPTTVRFWSLRQVAVVVAITLFAWTLVLAPILIWN